MKLRLSVLLPALALAATLIVGHPAQAQVSLTLQPAALTGMPGQTLQFSGTIQNLGTVPVFLNGDLFNPAALPGLTLDDSPFITNAPSELFAAGDSGATYTGPLFDATFAPGFYTETFTGSYALIGGTDANAISPNDVLASAPFQATAVPEPSGLALLACGAFLLVGLRLAARRRAF